MIFLVVISIAILALSNWTQNSLSDSLKFQQSSQRLYAAEGVTQFAIRASRYTYLDGQTGTNASGYICPGTPSPVLINTYFIQDWCSTVTYGYGTVTRVITVTACLMPSTSSQLVGPGLCQIGTSTFVPNLLTAVLHIDDVISPNESPPPCTSVSNESTCGANMIIYSWNAT